MARRVKTPDGVTHSFPDDATDQEISEALSTPPATARGKPARSWTDTAVDLLPAVGGTVGGIVGGIGGTAFGMGVGGVPGAMGGAALLGGAGEGAKQLINRARGASDVPTSATDAAGDIALQGGVQGALEGVGAAVGPALVKGGQAVYRGYLKPSLSAKNLPKADEIVRTAINESLPVTKAGAAQAQKVIGQLRTQADNILASMPGEVDLHVVADKLRTWARTVYDRPGRAPSDLEAAMEVANRIDKHPSLGPAAPAGTVSRGATSSYGTASWTVEHNGKYLGSFDSEAQALKFIEDTLPANSARPVALTVANQVKRDMQSGASSAFGVKSGAEKSAEKQGSRLLRQDIEAVAPEVGPINARESKLIDAAKALERATGREGNLSKVYGTRMLVAGTVGGGAEYKRSGDPYRATAMSVALAAGMHPALATRVAFLAAQLGAKMPGQAPAAVARAAMQAVSEAQEQSDHVPQGQQ